jgi:hypothetical protein
MSDYIVHGVPQSVLQDAWWLSSSSGQGGDAPPGRGVGRLSGGRGIAVLGLVLLADWMFFDQAVGLSLGLYAGVLASVCWAVSRQGASHREWAVRLGILALAVLPVIEDVQVLSLGILGLGLAVIAVRMVVGREAGVAGFLAALARFAGQVPIAAFRDAYLGLKDTQVSAQGTRAAASLWRAWALPGTLGVGFVALLVGSNPVMAHWAEALGQIGFDPATLARRLTFWGFVAVLIWPFLAVLQLADRLLRPFSRQSTGQLATRRSGRFGINSASVANSLGLFNLIFAVQTGLDLTYLWGGAVLPDGMTHATYAHRGAYPLVVTALLAGVFALISRPYTDGRPVLRGLLMLWIGQNVLLVVSALYRLDLYIGEFGLTYLRVRAAKAIFGCCSETV